MKFSGLSPFIFMVLLSSCFNSKLKIEGLEIGRLGGSTERTFNITNIQYQIDGDVFSAVEHNNDLYIGGDFRNVGIASQSTLLYFQNDLEQVGLNTLPEGLELPSDFLGVNGAISGFIPDADGGLYITGSFTQILGETRNRMARLLPNLTLDPDFNPDFSNTVESAVIVGDVIYAIGAFTSVNGSGRNRIIALNRYDGSIDPSFAVGGGFSFVSSIAMRKIHYAADRLFVVGQFETVKGTNRENIVAFELNGTIDNDFNIHFDDQAYDLESDGTYLYVGGRFDNIARGGGYSTGIQQARSKLARIELTAGYPIAAAYPTIDEKIQGMTIAENQLFIGGEFVTIGGFERKRLASFSLSDHSLTSFAPLVDPQLTVPSGNDSVINNLLYHDGHLYIGGEFNFVNSQERKSIAAIRMADQAVRTFDPKINGRPRDFAILNNMLFVGGNMTAFANERVQNFVVMSKDRTTLRSWRPRFDNIVRAVNVLNDVIYIGGYFDNVDGISRSRLAAFDANTKNLTPLSLAFTGDRVLSINGNDQRVVVMGEFSEVEGVTRDNILFLDPNQAHTNLVTKGILNIAIGFDNDIQASVKEGSQLYLVGSFQNALTPGSLTRRRFAVINLATDSLVDLGWDANLSAAATAITKVGSKLYLGGSFTNARGSACNRLAVIEISDGNLDKCANITNQQVRSIFVQNNLMIAFGTFTSVNGTSNLRRRVALYDIDAAHGATPVLLADNPQAGDSIWTHVATDIGLFVFGGFSSYYGQPHYSPYLLTSQNLEDLEP